MFSPFFDAEIQELRGPQQWYSGTVAVVNGNRRACARHPSGVGFVGRNPRGAPNDQTESLVVEKDLWLQCNLFLSNRVLSFLFGLSSATWTSAFYGYRIKRSKIVYEFHCVSFRHSMHFLLFRIFLRTLHWSVPNHQLARICSGVAALRRRNTGHCQHLWVKRWSRHLSQAQIRPY